MPDLGFTPSTKVFLIKLLAAVVVILAFIVERKGILPMWLQKKNTVTPVAQTYVEHNGVAAVTVTVAVNDAQKA
ncbi:TPA: hypothetical protein DCQ44_03365 [Candidatus Taylorbacteria bacterium]|nr:hypothetical protein [Candidatus Taylorbacteria bacterium]